MEWNPDGDGTPKPVRREGVLFLSFLRCVGVDLNIFLFFLLLSGSSSKGEMAGMREGNWSSGDCGSVGFKSLQLQSSRCNPPSPGDRE